MNRTVEIAGEIQKFSQENEDYNVSNDNAIKVSLFSVSFLLFIGVVYLILGTLSMIQISSTIEWRAINIVESNGRRTRPYFLKIFTISLIIRLLYIILMLVLCFDPLFMVTIGIKRFRFLEVYDYFICASFLTSYSVIMCLWSSILNKPYNNELLKTIQIPLIIVMNISIYVLSGFYTLIVFKKETFNIEMFVYLFTGMFYLTYSFLWFYLGFELVKQISKRQSIYNELGEGLVNKHTSMNSGVLKSKNYSNINQSKVIEISPKLNFNLNIYSETTSSSSPSLSSRRFFYYCIYKSTITDLKDKILLITLVCPLSLMLSSTSYIVDGLFLLYKHLTDSPEYAIRGDGDVYISPLKLELNGVYLLLTEILPSLAIIYGFWNNKSQRNMSDINDTSSKNNNVNSILRYTNLPLDKILFSNQNNAVFNGAKTDRCYYNIEKY